MKSTFIINEKQKDNEIFIKTPNRGNSSSTDGTMVIQDDVITYDFKNDSIPVYRECADGNKRIVRGPAEIIRDGDGSIGTADGIKFNTENTEVTISFGNRNSTKQIMPSGDGYILNSSSVVDCGEIEMENGAPKLSEPHIGKTSLDLENK